MRQVLLLITIALGFSGCLLNPSTETYPETLTEGDLTFHPSEQVDTVPLIFSISLDGKSAFFKKSGEAATDNILTDEDRVRIFNYRKGRVDSIYLSFQIKKDSKYEDYSSYTLPVVDGVCGGNISLPQAKFLLTASSVSKSGASDFEGSTEVDTREFSPRVELTLVARPYIEGSLKIKLFNEPNAPLKSSIYFWPLWDDEEVFEIVGNYLYFPMVKMEIVATRFNDPFAFMVNGEKYQADNFSIMTMIGDDVIPSDGVVEVFARKVD